MLDIHDHRVIQLGVRKGALGVTEKSQNFISSFTRHDAHRLSVSLLSKRLMPFVGGECGPWFTFTID